jgi:hypothetical protein
MSVRSLRKIREELQLIFDELMDACLISNDDIEGILRKREECIRECIRPVYTKAPLNLPYPQPVLPPPPPPPAPTISGVHLILYLDSTGSMIPHYRSTFGSELNAFASNLKAQSDKAGIPCTVSLYWFGDATTGPGQLVKQVLDKADVSQLAGAIAAPVLLDGGDIPESGFRAMYDTLNGSTESGVQNTLIYATDAISKTNEGASATAVKGMLDGLGIIPFGIRPSKDTAIDFVFNDTRDFELTNHNLDPWIDKILNP